MAEIYPLQALLSVRWFREDAAKNEVRAAERQVTEAQEQMEKKRAALEAYQAWLPKEVDHRYESIMGQEMSLNDIDAFKGGLAALADGELTKQMALVEAKKELALRMQEMEKAREAVAQARREAAKIEAHREIWKEEVKKEAERKEDLEMEEFKPPAKENTDE